MADTWPPVIPGVEYYYVDEQTAIICGDSEFIELPPVDLLITDPPYGMLFQSSWTIETRRKKRIHCDDAFPLWIFDKIKPRIASFVFCRWDNLAEIPKPRSFVIWDKGAHSMGDLQHEFGRQYEGVAFYPGPDHKFLKRPVDIIRTNKIAPANLMHPAEKPIAVIAPLITSHPGQVVLDPFMGVGSVLMAAKRAGRRSIGIEIDEQYCSLAAERLSQGVLNF
jgi:site-specific DNA-methyltransferase (adenine-specific)